MVEVMGRHAQAAEEAIERESAQAQAMDDGAMKRLSLAIMPVFFRGTAKELDRGTSGPELATAVAALAESMLKLVLSGYPEHTRDEAMKVILEGLGEDIPVDLREARITLAAALLSEVDEQGVTHIISGDGNMEDDNLAFVRLEMKYYEGGGTPDERELMELLEKMTLADRDSAWDRR